MRCNQVMVIVLAFLLMALVGCTRSAPSVAPATTSGSGAEQARAALTGFFAALQERRYADAVPLYGGSYEQLRTWNPDAPADDAAGLLAAGCMYNGLNCLQVGEIVSSEALSADQYRFVVRFRNPDGTPFVLGPCCGATEEEMPPVREFTYTVVRTSTGTFTVEELPPYTP